MVQTKQIKGSGDNLTPIEDFATAWGVNAKTVQNWSEFVYQAFEIVLPANGPFSDWQIQLLTLCAKHVSTKASLYHAETGERRRLKGSEFVEKMRRLRKEGHFQEFQKFQSFQNSQTLAPAEDLEDELLAEVGALTREGDERVAKLKQAIERKEDQQVSEILNFVDDSDHRMLSKLTSGLHARKALRSADDDASPCIDDAIEAAYERID
ncbi:hypothetical protein NDI45_19410 [Leptolyngbya sp. GB1-A1]|uniref:hypothetical protein n=1 Tax=Leptolyngbya sp. GB1-A1 TaxID=2933908 RepID=UPI003299EDF1